MIEEQVICLTKGNVINTFLAVYSRFQIKDNTCYLWITTAGFIADFGWFL
jgi:hypothetical protein